MDLRSASSWRTSFDKIDKSDRYFCVPESPFSAWHELFTQRTRLEDSPAWIASFNSERLHWFLCYVGWWLDNDLGISSVIPSRLRREVKFGRNTSLCKDYIPNSNKFGPAFLGENAMYFGCVSAGTCIASQCVEGSCKFRRATFFFHQPLHSEAIEATCECPSDSSSAHTS